MEVVDKTVERLHRSRVSTNDDSLKAIVGRHWLRLASLFVLEANGSVSGSVPHSTRGA